MTELDSDVFRTLGSVDAIPNDFVVPYYLDDVKLRIAIARVGNRFYAFDDLCTCGREACPLSGGLLTGTTIMCQCHGSRFDISTGAIINGPATAALNLYTVHEKEGAVRIRLRRGARVARESTERRVAVEHGPKDAESMAARTKPLHDFNSNNTA